MDHSEEARLDRIIHVLIVSRKTAEKAAHEAAQAAAQVGAGAGSLPKPQDPEPAPTALNPSSFSSARRTDPLARSSTAAAGRLSTRAELLQRIEADRGRPVLPRRLQLILAAFTRPAAEGDDEARTIDLPAMLLHGFDDFLTDTASHRFSAGEIVLLTEPEEPEPPAPGKERTPCDALLLFDGANRDSRSQTWTVSRGCKSSR
jgi:hypothetical protein